MTGLCERIEGPMRSQDSSGRPPFFVLLLVLTGVFFMALAILFNEFFLELLDPDPPLAGKTIHGIRQTQSLFLVFGVSALLLAFCVSRISSWRRLVSGTSAANLLLCLLSLLVPPVSLELCLRPFARFEEMTTIFQRDDSLGWKLKPGVSATWGGVKVEINSKGLRGPALDYAKPPGVKRVLYLGDSVTFGYGLGSYEETFPFLVERRLQKHLREGIQTVNAGVDGYGSWQERIYLVQEGIRYSPDLVVVCFVLNDVTEKLDLIRFGGRSEGPQLARTVSGSLDRLLKKSSLVQFGGRLLARMRFGTEVRTGALKEELLNVESLAIHPDRQDVRKAWQGALADLGGIFDFCRAKSLPVVLVVFPYTFQFANPDALRSPQETVLRLAREMKVPALDLLPFLSETMRRRGGKPDNFFLDIGHLSPVGSQVVSEALADFLLKSLQPGAEGLQKGS
jgi:lysophospholipase L1-like esterase